MHVLKLLVFKNPIGVLEMKCSKGTYVRSLIHDLGEALGVGACVETIHRIESSPFSIKDAVSLEVLLEMELEDIEQRMLSVRDALSSFKTIEVSREEEALIRQGVEYSKHNVPNPVHGPDDFFLFVSKDNRREIAMGRWGEKTKIEYLRIF